MIDIHSHYGLFYGAEADSYDNPNGTDVFGVHDNLDTDCVPHLVTTAQHYYIFAYLVLENVVDHSVRLEVGELNWERLEGVTFWHIIFN